MNETNREINKEIVVKLIPTWMIHPKSEAALNGDYRIYDCKLADNPDKADIKYNSRGAISIKGGMQKLELYREHVAHLILDAVHPTFGASYWVSSVYEEIPETADDQKEFFKTLLTENQVQAMYEAYPDENIVQLIANDNFNPQIVKGFGPVVYARVQEKIMSNLVYKDVLAKFGRYGIKYDTILKLEKIYGRNIPLIIDKLEKNPYVLTKLPRWGFKRADRVAQAMGIKEDNPFRIRSGIVYTLEKNEQEGHTYMFRDELLRGAAENLDIDLKYIDSQIEQTREIKILNDKISTISAYNAEVYIAKKLKDILINTEALPFDAENFIEKIEKKYQYILKDGLTHQQKDFFRNIQKYGVNLLVGYAGTGKSQLQKFLLDLLHELKMSYVFLSPSAKAAKVTKSYTGANAQTMHRKLKYTQDKKEKDLTEITEDFVLIDEAGMADVFIISKLLNKITNPKTRILFVGDDFQLASIQAGNFLYDTMNSGVIPMTKLDIVFRQEEGGLLDIATKIREGTTFLDNDFTGTQKFGDDFFIHCLGQEYMVEAYQRYYKMFLKSHDPKDIMVLSPTKKTRIGTIAINQYIQSIVNPAKMGKQEYEYGENDEFMFRTGDYILNTTNMYDRITEDGREMDVVNGDVGEIIQFKLKDDPIIDPDDPDEVRKAKRGIIVEIEGQQIKLGFDLAPQLLHAWSYTIHKSQGSACDASIVLADRAHKRQLTANLIYTALTRSRGKSVLLTQAETLNYAIRKVEGKRRNTHLKDMLIASIKRDVQIPLALEAESA